MTDNRKINIALSIILAIILWAYVISEANPTTTKMFKDVTITYVNTEIMDENGYAILSSEFETVNVTVRGKRSLISDINVEDILVTADMMDVAKGENEIRLSVVLPDNIMLDSINKKNLEVSIEQKATKEFRSQIKFINLSSAQEEPIVIEQAKQEFIVSGAETLVDSVNHTQIMVDANDINDEMRTLKVTAVPVDKNGIEIMNLAVEDAETTVTVVNCKTKTVKLNVNVENEEDDKYQRTYTSPKTITIKGYDEYLSDIKVVETEVIDISSVTESQKISLVPILPSNVYVADVSKGLKLDVLAEEYLSKEFSLTEKNIKIRNLANGLTSEIKPGNFQINLVATGDIISGLVASDIVLSIDVEDLSVGSYYLELIPSTEKEIYKIKVIPNKISVELSDKNNI